ncbi:SPFH domain-containing protein [Streptomyces sudanensis]|uniref:SPFH domain-containing protein n=1 Tax=Streptomyces sudanensis TaxID=436397 RepID=UPI0020CCB084|nr:SPFH domain-containing protein [Streptomyces sudanensis]MCP9958013.1 SPFH domain-containing protein [Streptomyces sudanensis]MCQ0001459.1 SPFH domain-containing protein [Streptomyces sudanensis]
MNLAIFLIGAITAKILASPLIWMLVLLFGAVMLVGRIARKERERGKQGKNRRNSPLMELVLLGVLVPRIFEVASRVGLLSISLVIVFALAVLVALKGFRTVPADHVGIVYRAHGSSHPKFPNVTPHNTRGVLARTLRPGQRCWLFPLLYHVKYVPRVRVEENNIGLVTAKEGKVRPAGRSLAARVECDNFQDGEAFLLNGGEQGRQVDTLANGQTYCINTELFEVEQVHRVYIPQGTIGLVNARAGGIRPPDRLFGPHVECDNFQDGISFLAGGGQQGVQLAILQGGAYYNINPAVFDVATSWNVGGRKGELGPHHLKEISIPPGYTGVVITLDGAEPESPDRPAPRVPGHQGFRLPWVFLQNGGQRGVQEETLREGTVCALNPYFVRVVLIPTRVLILEWNDKSPAERLNYDAHLGRIAVTVQGHRLFVDMSQTLRIPPESAPLLVSKNGGSQTTGIGGLDWNPLPVQRFVERVLGAIVVSYFNEIAAAATVKEFLEAYAETRTDLASQVRNALQAWGVEAQNTTLGEFMAEDPKLNEVLKRPAHEQMRSELLDLELANAEREDAIDVVKVRAESRRVALELKNRIEVLGPENVMVLEMLRELTKAPVPQFIGGGDLSAYLATQPVARLEELLEKMRSLQEKTALESGQQSSLTEGATRGEIQADARNIQGDIQ